MASHHIDSELAFLKDCSNEDLDLLVSILTIDPKTQHPRYDEKLTANDKYKTYYPLHHHYWELIAITLQQFGDSHLNVLKEEAKLVSYRQIILELCQMFHVDVHQNANIEQLELSLLLSVLKEALTRMNAYELSNLLDSMGIDITHDKISAASVFVCLRENITEHPYLISMIVYSALRQIGFNTEQSFVYSFSSILTPKPQILKLLFGPIGWVIHRKYREIRFVGPCYDVTIPACFVVAYLRQKSLNSPVIEEV